MNPPNSPFPQNSLDQLEHLPIRHFNISRQIPTQMHHRHDALEALQLIPLVPIDRQVILARRQRTHIPGDIVTPSDRLHPVHTARIHPHQIAGPLYEPVHRNIRLVQILQHRPPGSVQIVDVVAFAQLLNAAPIGVRHGEPFAIARPNVDVDGAKVVVLLVARRPAARHFHVQLHSVHAEYDVTDVRQHICGADDARKGGQLLQFGELEAPLALVGEIDVGAETVWVGNVEE